MARARPRRAPTAGADRVSALGWVHRDADGPDEPRPSPRATRTTASRSWRRCLPSAALSSWNARRPRPRRRITSTRNFQKANTVIFSSSRPRAQRLMFVVAVRSRGSAPGRSTISCSDAPPRTGGRSPRTGRTRRRTPGGPRSSRTPLCEHFRAAQRVLDPLVQDRHQSSEKNLLPTMLTKRIAPASMSYTSREPLMRSAVSSDETR